MMNQLLRGTPCPRSSRQQDTRLPEKTGLEGFYSGTMPDSAAGGSRQFHNAKPPIPGGLEPHQLEAQRREVRLVVLIGIVAFLAVAVMVVSSL